MSHSPAESHPLLAELTAAEREQAMQRYAIISPLLTHSNSPRALWEAASIEAKCSIRTVRRWVNSYHQDGLVGLVRKRRADQGRRRVISAEMEQLIQALYLEHGHRTFQNVHRLVKAYAENEQLPVPSYTTVRAVCKALPASVTTYARQGKIAWRDQFEPILRFESNRPNECWQMDHCRLDIIVVDELNQKVLGRPWLTVALDTFSRAVVGYYLSLTTPSSLTICFTLRRAILSKDPEKWPMHGIPETVHIDRGADFASRHLAQVAADLQIKLVFATSYLARAKGKIERFFDTLNKEVWCELPGYVGNSIADRPEKVSPQLTLAEVERYLLGFILNRYHQRVHSTTHATPCAQWQQPDFAPRLPSSERGLDLLLMLTEERVVQRDGIRFHHLQYWNHALIDLIGQRVQIRFDPESIGEIVVYHGGCFICLAAAPQLDGLAINLADWRALQARQRRSLKDVVKAYRSWLDAKRATLVPILSKEDVDLAILMERTIDETQPEHLPLFPSDALSAQHTRGVA